MLQSGGQPLSEFRKSPPVAIVTVLGIDMPIFGALAKGWTMVGVPRAASPDDDRGDQVNQGCRGIVLLRSRGRRESMPSEFSVRYESRLP